MKVRAAGVEHKHTHPENMASFKKTKNFWRLKHGISESDLKPPES